MHRTGPTSTVIGQIAGQVAGKVALAAVAAVSFAGALLSQPNPAAAQGRGSCVRLDTALVPSDQLDLRLAGQSAQRLMNEIAKQTSSGPMPVAGALVFKGAGQVVILWIRGEYVCSNGPYERAVFDRAERAVFGVDA